MIGLDGQVSRLPEANATPIIARLRSNFRIPSHIGYKKLPVLPSQETFDAKYLLSRNNVDAGLRNYSTLVTVA